jgi:hypothetical protein
VVVGHVSVVVLVGVKGRRAFVVLVTGYGLFCDERGGARVGRVELRFVKVSDLEVPVGLLETCVKPKLDLFEILFFVQKLLVLNRFELLVTEFFERAQEGLKLL